MPDDESLPDFGWVEEIQREIAAAGREVFLVGHSLGASMLLKCLSENRISSRIRGIFLLATPFWSGSEEWEKGLMLREDFASALPRDISIFLYHSGDDEEVDVSSLDIYEARLPRAIARRPATGGHQFDNDLALVARDIQSLG
jgi:predicted alpha/beta hydrolase family esterase